MCNVSGSRGKSAAQITAAQKQQKQEISNPMVRAGS